MKKTPIGLAIKAVMKKKNLSPTKIAQELGMAKQQVYNTYMRTELRGGEIEKWAKALDVSVEELTNYSFESRSSSDGGAFGDEVLQTIKKLLEEELKEKNDQIRALQDSLRQSQKALEQAQDLSSRLLGKSRKYRDENVLPMYNDEYPFQSLFVASR